MSADFPTGASHRGSLHSFDASVGTRDFDAQAWARYASLWEGENMSGDENRIKTQTESTRRGGAHAQPSRGILYMPALDGVRALAVLAVLLYHLDVPWAGGGLMGVTVFFVLSGYLITKLLLVEFTQSGTINFKGFWLRRAKRLLPAIVTLMIVMGALYTFFNHALLTKMRSDLLPSLFFVNNWWQIFHNVSYFDNLGAPSPLTHFWSLAIEEQYYLVFPIFIFLVLRMKMRRRNLQILTGMMAAASALAMLLLYNPDVDPSRVYYGTDTRAFSLLIGALLAISTIGRAPVLNKLARQAVGAVGLLGIVLVVIFSDGMSSFPYYGGILLVSLLTAMLLYGVVQPDGGPLTWALSIPPMAWLGQRSYGVYLWHFPIILLMTDQNAASERPLWLTIVQIVTVLAISELSYRFVEMPVRKNTFFARVARSQEKGAKASVAHAVKSGARVGAATATESASGNPALIDRLKVAVRVAGAVYLRFIKRLPLLPAVTTALLVTFCVSSAGFAFVPSTSVLGAEAEQAIIDGGGQAANPSAPSGASQGGENGAQAGASSNSGATPSSSSGDAPSASAGDAASASAGATPSEGASSQSSQSSSSSSSPKDDGFAADAYPIVVVGDSVARGASLYFQEYFPGGYIDAQPNRQIAAGIEVYKQIEATGKVGKKVVVSLGTNAYLTPETIEQMIAAIGEKRHIWFVTVRKPGPSKYKTNEAIAQAAANHDNVDYVDWFSASEGHNEYFNGDGTHLSYAGARVYWQLIQDAVNKN